MHGDFKCKSSLTRNIPTFFLPRTFLTLKSSYSMGFLWGLFSYLWQTTTLSFLLWEELCSQESDFCSRKPSRCFISFALQGRRGERIMPISSFIRCPNGRPQRVQLLREGRVVYLGDGRGRWRELSVKQDPTSVSSPWLTINPGTQAAVSATEFWPSVGLGSLFYKPVTLTDGTLGVSNRNMLKMWLRFR